MKKGGIILIVGISLLILAIVFLLGIGWFWGGNMFPTDNINTISLEQAGYTKDSQYVYYHSKIVEGADHQTFQGLSTGVGKDADNVFMFGKKVTVDDVRNFVLISYPSDKLNAGAFFKDSRSVYRCVYTCADGLIKVVGANPKTFQVVEESYLKDNKNVYYQSIRSLSEDGFVIQLIAGADPKTFEPIEYKPFLDLNLKFSRDKSKVFYENQSISRADPSSFVAFDRAYGKDSQHVYFKNQIIVGADPGTFKPWDDISYYPDWTRDAENSYSEYPNYSQDSKNIYYDGQIIVGVDSQTFSLLNNNYGKDSKNIFYKGKLIPNADISTFEIMGNGYAKDKYRTYYQGNPVSN